MLISIYSFSLDSFWIQFVFWKKLTFYSSLISLLVNTALIMILFQHTSYFICILAPNDGLNLEMIQFEISLTKKKKKKKKNDDVFCSLPPNPTGFNFKIWAN